MISFHRDMAHIGDASRYMANWEPANINVADRIALGMQRFPWSGIVWWSGIRQQAYFGRACWVVLDFDSGELTLAQAEKNFCDCVHIIGTTKSHQKAKNGVICDRFRVALRLERPIEDSKIYVATMKHYINKWDADPACHDGARFFWPCTEIIQYADEGYELEVILPPPPRKRSYSTVKKAQIIPSRLHPRLRELCPAGQRNSRAFWLGAELTRCGFSAEHVHEIMKNSGIKLPPDELERAVDNGIKTAMAEAVNGGCDEHQRQAGEENREAEKNGDLPSDSGEDVKGHIRPA